MERIVVEPPKPGIKLVEGSEPARGREEFLVETLEVGIDGTDLEIVRGEYGTPPTGEDYLTLGHEALGRVLEVPGKGGLQAGDLVNPTVRRGCGLCVPCKTGQSDFCFTGLFKERGIKGLHGFMSPLFVETEEYLVRVPPDIREVAILTEPASVAVKAVNQVLKIQERMPWREEKSLGEKKALVAGAGSLGLMATFLLRSLEAEVITMDRSPDDCRKSELIEAMGAHHLNSMEVDPLELAKDFDGFDIILEATGAARVPFHLTRALATNGIMVLLGVPGRRVSVEVEASEIVKDMVLENQVVFGCVNSNATHFREAHKYLKTFLERYPRELKEVLSHRYPWREFENAFEERGKDVIKRVLVWQED
ncbi:MAG: glucose 1-dehydrogenase [Candidatus Thermoplasmatota archaeon]|nr:glucose 1-dehydrogenase [Candidatus Thermoplasmatota archaeon]